MPGEEVNRQQPARLSLINGRWANTISVLDRGLCFGDGLFETMRFQAGRIALWPLHKRRLLAGCARLRITLHEADLDAQLDTFLAAVNTRNLAENPGPDNFLAVKLMVTRGEGGQGYYPRKAGTSIIFTLREMGAVKDDPIELWPCDYRLEDNKTLAGIKHLSRLEYVLAGAEVDALAPKKGRCFEGLLFDQRGHCVETIHHNVLVVKQGEIMSPKLECCGVSGVMRTFIQETVLQKLGMTLSLADLTHDDLYLADEIILSNALRGVRSVTSYANREYVAGPITEKLRASIEHYWS